MKNLPPSADGGIFKYLRQPAVVICLVIFVYLGVKRAHVLRSEFVFITDTKEPDKGVIVPEIKCPSSLKGSQKQSVSCGTEERRLLDYCSFHIPPGSESDRALSRYDLELRHLVIAIRHGDRSAIHTMPGSAPVSGDNNNLDDKDGSPKLLDPRALEHASRLKSFTLSQIVEPASGQGSNKVGKGSLDSLNITRIFQTNDNNLPGGQLTSRGFMQHIHLGKHLHQAYKGYLERVKSPVNLYVRSTNYDRTVQSVAALLSTFLPNVGGPLEQIPIKYYAEEASEIMHGVGLKLSSHKVDASGEKSLDGSCNKAVALAKKERESFVPAPKTIKAVADIFGDGVKNRFITDLADATLPSVCHNRPLPCAYSDPTKCLTYPLAGAIMAEADRSFCDRYTGPQGGGNATALSVYPLMKEVLGMLQKAASVSSAPANSTFLNVLSGHDTVVAPVLAALGVYQSKKLCIWPPYASRIVFELWMPSKGNKRGGDVHIQGASLSASQAFVRVVFNGLDVTSLIPSCAGEAAAAAAAAKAGKSLRTTATSGSNGALCSLNAFANQIESLIHPRGNFELACK